MIDPFGHVVTQEYNDAGLLGTVTNRNGYTRTFEYDDAGRTTSETWYDSSWSVTEQMTFEYNPSGQMTLAANSNGTYTFAYDDNLLVNATTPWGVNFTFGYDSEAPGVITKTTSDRNSATIVAKMRSESGKGQQQFSKSRALQLSPRGSKLALSH